MMLYPGMDSCINDPGCPHGRLLSFLCHSCDQIDGRMDQMKGPSMFWDLSAIGACPSPPGPHGHKMPRAHHIRNLAANTAAADSIAAQIPSAKLLEGTPSSTVNAKALRGTR